MVQVFQETRYLKTGLYTRRYSFAQGISYFCGKETHHCIQISTSLDPILISLYRVYIFTPYLSKINLNPVALCTNLWKSSLSRAHPQAEVLPLIGCLLLLIQHCHSFPPYLAAVSFICSLRTSHAFPRKVDLILLEWLRQEVLDSWNVRHAL
jgi:hypothetical protein